MREKAGNNVVLLCEVHPDCSGQQWKYMWFLFQKNYHIQLKLSPDKYKLNKASLQINSLQANDTGIYHCAAVSSPSGHKMQYVSTGQTLIVEGEREREHAERSEGQMGAVVGETHSVCLLF